ncbi:MAG: hypothetical protein GXY08_10540 [Ruminococcus sp.]|nr:hypothetical protein [Ruminococcus sp.]
MKEIDKERCFSYAIICTCLAGAVSGLMMVIGYAMYHYYEYYDKLVLNKSLESYEKNHYFSSAHFCISTVCLFVLLIILAVFSIRCINCLKRYGKLYITLPAVFISWAAISGTSALLAVLLLHPIIFPY